MRISNVWAMATTAGDLLPPDLLVIRQNLSLRKQFFLAEAAHDRELAYPGSYLGIKIPGVVPTSRPGGASSQ